MAHLVTLPIRHDRIVDDVNSAGLAKAREDRTRRISRSIVSHQDVIDTLIKEILNGLLDNVGLILDHRNRPDRAVDSRLTK